MGKKEPLLAFHLFNTFDSRLQHFSAAFFHSVTQVCCLHDHLTPILRAGAAFVELYFVLSSLFASKAYYAFGFLALTAGVVGLTTATVSILFTYFLLCSEEYRYVIISFMIPKLTGCFADGIGGLSSSEVEVHSGSWPMVSFTGHLD